MREFESSSDPKTFGQIYFDMERKSAFGWAEILAHELGHQYLNAHLALGYKNIKAPMKERFFSAIRQELRPLVGILHSTIAETFMVLLSRSVLRLQKFK